MLITRAGVLWVACITAFTASSAGGSGERREAAPARLTALSGAYEQRAVRTITHERRVLDRGASWEAGGLRSVPLVDHARLYRTAGCAALALRSTPDLQAHDRASLPSAEAEGIVEWVVAPFSEELPELRPLGRTETWQARVLGRSATVTTFVPSTRDRWRVHALKLRSAGDVVAAVVVAPAATTRAEVRSLLSGIEHAPEA